MCKDHSVTMKCQGRKHVVQVQSPHQEQEAYKDHAVTIEFQCQEYTVCSDCAMPV